MWHKVTAKENKMADCVLRRSGEFLLERTLTFFDAKDDVSFFALRVSLPPGPGVFAKY